MKIFNFIFTISCFVSVQSTETLSLHKTWSLPLSGTMWIKNKYNGYCGGSYLAANVFGIGMWYQSFYMCLWLRQCTSHSWVKVWGRRDAWALDEGKHKQVVHKERGSSTLIGFKTQVKLGSLATIQVYLYTATTSHGIGVNRYQNICTSQSLNMNKAQQGSVIIHKQVNASQKVVDHHMM